jgi:hypothetical protein
MIELNRRWFLGGAISLVAAQTFVPSVMAMKNLPTIYGNGRDDDTSGLIALLNKDPVTFNKEQIGVESHGGLRFHKGRFLISNTLNVPENSGLDMRTNYPGGPVFDCSNLPDNFPVFLCRDNLNFGNDIFVFEFKKTYRGKIVAHVGDKFKYEDY